MSSTEIFSSFIENAEVANAVAAIASAVIATVAVVLSLISIYVSLSSLKHQREHNRMSVRPLAYVALGDYEGQLFVKIWNNGTGPMIIKSITVAGSPQPLLPLIRSMPKLLPNVDWTNFVEDFSGRSIPVSSSLELLNLSCDSSSCSEQFTLSRDEVRVALGKLTILVEYTDIYETKLPICSRSLEFFHRTLSV